MFPNFGVFFQAETIVQPEGAKIHSFFENHMNHVANITLSSH
jgi:hypothetical protein